MIRSFVFTIGMSIFAFIGNAVAAEPPVQTRTDFEQAVQISREAFENTRQIIKKSEEIRQMIEQRMIEQQKERNTKARP